MKAKVSSHVELRNTAKSLLHDADAGIRKRSNPHPIRAER
jgi:hypothetical protein